MTKAASFPDDNGYLCEGCNDPESAYRRQRTFLLLMAGLGSGTIWLCDACAVKRGHKEPATNPGQSRVQMKPSIVEAADGRVVTTSGGSSSSSSSSTASSSTAEAAAKACTNPKPAPASAPPPSQPYREPPPPCAACAARAAALAQLEKFAYGPACPLCGHSKPVRTWSQPHRNEVRTFTIKNRKRDPWWYLFWRKTYPATPASTPTFSFTGNDAAPLHFHLECTDCNHHWRMRTAKWDV